MKKALIFASVISLLFSTGFDTKTVPLFARECTLNGIGPLLQVVMGRLYLYGLIPVMECAIYSLTKLTKMDNYYGESKEL